MSDDFDRFYLDLKETEKEDSKLTPKQQIDRLLRPGSTYLNLNPFEVLQIDHEASVDDAKKRYKKLSLLIHPDRNQDDKERADIAFNILKRAIAQIEEPDELARCKDCYVEAQARLAIIMAEKRRKLKREGKEDLFIDEDTTAGHRKALWQVVTKVFADREKKRKQLEERANEEKRRAAEELQASIEKRKREEEFTKNYEMSRDDRRGSWREFVTRAEKKKEKGKEVRGAAFKPPKPKLMKM